MKKYLHTILVIGLSLNLSCLAAPPVPKAQSISLDPNTGLVVSPTNFWQANGPTILATGSNVFVTALGGTNTALLAAQSALSNAVVSAVGGTNTSLLAAQAVLSNAVVAALGGTNTALAAAKLNVVGGTASNLTVTGTHAVDNLTVNTNAIVGGTFTAAKSGIFLNGLIVSGPLLPSGGIGNTGDLTNSGAIYSIGAGNFGSLVSSNNATVGGNITANSVTATNGVSTTLPNGTVTTLANSSIPTEAVFCTGTLNNWLPSARPVSTDYSYRKRFQAAVSGSNIRCYWAGTYVLSGSFVNFSSTYKASFQFADSTGAPVGSAIPLTFNSSTTGTVPSGGFLVNDPLPVSVAAGDYFFITTYVPNGSYAGINGNLSNASGDNYYAGDATGNASLFTNNQYQAGAQAIGPGMITAMVLPSDRKGVAGIGDSVMGNANDEVNGGGWLNRGINNTRGYVNLGIGGARTTGITNQATYLLAWMPLRFCRDAVLDYGLNDLSADNDSAATVESAALKLLTTVKSFGIRKRILCTVKPFPTSTDSFTTTNNETIASNDAARQTYNAWVLTQTGVSCEGTFDFAATLAANGNPALLATGPLNVLFTDTCGTGSTASTIYASAAGIGTISQSGGIVALTHAATTYYGQVKSWRPTAGGTNQIAFAAALGATPSVGDSYTVYQGWGSDTAGAHPTGYGHAAAAAGFNLSILN